MPKFKVEVDREKCIGCGACEAVCPENFSLKDGKSYPKKAVVTELGCNLKAAAGCPVNAIKITKA
jgi:ferredoxin